MRCIKPLKAGYDFDYNIIYSQKKLNPEVAAFEFNCRQCLPCLLNTARDKGVRAWHESKMHPFDKSIFLTLTYRPEELKSPFLVYEDWQKFIRSLRDKISEKAKTKECRDSLYIPLMVTGEYGDKNKRPHWHALLFNYRPADAVFTRETDRGDRVYTSNVLNELWSKGFVEFGEVTIDSANYVARYGAKALAHGFPKTHPYTPLHKTSSRRAIGRSWIEKYYEQTFRNGYVVLQNGQPSAIPRYYTDWCKQHHFDLYMHYVTEVRPKIQELCEAQVRKDELDWFSSIANMQDGAPYPLTRPKVKETILKSKFKRLQERLKL